MSIFDKSQAIDEMQNERMPAVVNMYLGGAMPSPLALWNSVLAAEAEVARKLGGVSLEPVEIFSVAQPTAQELVELNGAPFLVETGYDMEGGMLGTFQWTCIQLRQRPVLAIRSVKIVYPTISTPIYDVPLDWIYIDSKAGLLEFTPKPTPAGMAPSIMGAAMMARGAQVPQMVRIRYQAGLTPKHPCMPEIKDLIMRAAMARHLKFAPQSSSISADGLSQSKSFSLDTYTKAIDAELSGLKDRIMGPTWSVL